MSSRSISVRLSMNASDFLAGAKAASSSLDDLVRKSGKSEQVASTGLGRMEQSARLQASEWQTVSGSLLKVGAAQAAIGTAVAVTGANYNRLQQSSRAALSTLVGGAQQANAQMDKLDAFAKTSPFSKATFIQAQQQMLAFGIEAKKVVPYLDAVQNAVAAAGGNDTSLRGIVEIMAKIQSSAKITATDLMQFGNWGVDAAGLIGSAMGKTGAQIRTEITSGTLDAGTALDALAQGMQSKFGGAAANVKNTFDGAFDRVKAAWRDVTAEMMEPFVGKTGGGLFTDLLNATADLMRGFQKLPTPVKDFTGALGLAATTTTLAAGAAMKFIPHIGQMVSSLTSLGSAGVPVLSKVATGFLNIGPSLKSIPGFVQAAGAGMREFGNETRVAMAMGESRIAAMGSASIPVLRNLGSAGKAAGSALLGAFGGPIGLAATAAITGLTMAVMNYQRKAQAAKQASREFADTLDEVSGAGTKMSREWAFDQIADRGGLENLKRAGLDLKEVGDAVENLDSTRLRELASAIENTPFEKLDGLSMKAIGDSAGDLRFIADAMDKAQENASLLAEGMDEAGSSADGMGGAVDGAADSLDAAADAAQGYLDALKQLTDRQDGNSDSVAKARSAQRAWLDTLDEANTLLEANGKNWDLSTTAGRENQAMVDKLGGAWRDNIDAMVSATDATGQAVYSLDEVKNAAQSSYDQFIALSTSLGASEEEAQFLAASLGLLPEDVATRYLMEVQGRQELEALLAQYPQIPEEIITLLAAQDASTEVIALVIQALDAGIPPEKITQLLADDYVTDKAQAIQAQIEGIPPEWLTIMKGSDEVSAPASIAKRSTEAIPQLWDTRLTADDQSSAKSKAAKSAAESIPTSRSTALTAQDNVSSVVRSAQSAINSLTGKTVTITTNYVTTGAIGKGGMVALPQANGGFVNVQGFAAGGEHHVAQYAPPGTWRVWAEDETGGEWYIPRALSKRARSERILADVAHDFGFNLVKGQAQFYANGSDPRQVYMPPAQTVAKEKPVTLSTPNVYVTVENPFTGEEVVARVKQTVVEFGGGR